MAQICRNCRIISSAPVELGWKDFQFDWDDELREQWFALAE